MKSNEDRLLDMLSNKDVTFYVPPYQRNYEWTENQCEVFVKDIRSTYEKNQGGTEAGHFIGSITYFQTEAVFGEPDRLILIDGQQRITTTMLYLIALRDTIDNPKLQEFINDNYLKNKSSYEDIEYKIKLKQVESDHAVYRKLVFGDKMTTRESSSPMYRNYLYFRRTLLDYVHAGIDLGELITKGLRHFYVIRIELQPDKNEWENPQEIFESMNSLGKPLTLADLVRNYMLLGLSAEKQDEYYRKYWLEIERTLPDMTSNFIRDYMQICGQHMYAKPKESNYKELYYEFKLLFGENAQNNGNTKKPDIEELLKTLKDYSGLYASIVLGADTGMRRINEILADIRTLNITTCYSLVMQILHYRVVGTFSDRETVDILNAIRIYFLRRRLLGINIGENKDIPTLVRKLRAIANRPDKGHAMFEILASQTNSTRLPNDIEVRKFLQGMNFYNFAYSKFYLSLIEEALTDKRPTMDDKDIQIDHIMPIRLSDEWRRSLGANAENIHYEYVDDIGNLTLTCHKKDIENESFTAKKAVYEHNEGFQIAKTNITNCSEWNEKSIKVRHAWLVNLMLMKIFPIPEEMRKTSNYNEKPRYGISFEKLGLIGETISFVNDDTITARIEDDKHVIFEDRSWTLLALANEINKREGFPQPKKHQEGARWWNWSGMRLSELIEEPTVKSKGIGGTKVAGNKKPFAKPVQKTSASTATKTGNEEVRKSAMKQTDKAIENVPVETNKFVPVETCISTSWSKIIGFRFKGEYCPSDNMTEAYIDLIGKIYDLCPRHMIGNPSISSWINENDRAMRKGYMKVNAIRQFRPGIYANCCSSDKEKIKNIAKLMSMYSLKENDIELEII